MKIAHIQVSRPKAESRITSVTTCIERLRGVVGVVAVRSMGLFTVLYDERRIDPVEISDAVVAATVEPDEEPPGPAAGARERAKTVVSSQGIPARI